MFYGVMPLTCAHDRSYEKLRMAICHTGFFFSFIRIAAYLPLGASCGTSRSGTIRPLSTATMCSSRRTTMLE